MMSPSMNQHLERLRRILLAKGTSLILGDSLYLPIQPLPQHGERRIRLNDQWFGLRKISGLLKLIHHWLLEDEGAEQCYAEAITPLELSVPHNCSTSRLYQIAWTLSFVQDVEEQLARLAQGNSAVAEGPVEGPYAAVLPSPISSDLPPFLDMLSQVHESALVVDGDIYALNQTQPGRSDQEAEVILEYQYTDLIRDKLLLTRGKRIATKETVAKLLQSAASKQEGDEAALRARYLDIIHHWQQRIEQGRPDDRLGAVLREFITPDALFRLVTRKGHVVVTLDCSPYIIVDNKGSAYRFDACVLGAMIPMPCCQLRNLSLPRILWPENYQSPFVSSEQTAYPRICTAGFLDHRMNFERSSLALIDWLICSRHVLRCGFLEQPGHSLHPYQQPSNWPHRLVPADELRYTKLPVYRYRR